MAGDPAFTELLLAMGLRSFSMHPARIASIKQRAHQRGQFVSSR
jgi:phosphotransferase system enzyme I (PtsI)